MSKHVIRLVAAALLVNTAGLFAQEDFTIQYGPNVIVNGDFEQDSNKDGIPDGWRPSVQTKGSPAELLLTEHNPAEGKRCAKIRFRGKDGIFQARYIQFVQIKPGKVYELAYSYRSVAHPRLKADILLTGTGPLYRSHHQTPARKWTRKRILFLIPEWVKTAKPTDGLGETGQAGIFVQNRSDIPIWYDDITLRETNLTETQLKQYRPTLMVQPETMADSMLFPQSQKTEAAFLPRITAPKDLKPHLGLQGMLLLYGKQRVVSLPETSGDGRITIPVASLPYGQTTVSFRLVDRRNGDVLAEHVQGVERFDPAEFSEVPDLEKAPLFLDRDGKPFFPITMYGVPMRQSDKDLQELREHGFNTLHDYSFEGTGDLKYVNAYLDRAQKMGFRVMTGLPRSLTEKAKNHPTLRDWVKVVSKHPAVLFYYADEMVSMRSTPMGTIASVHRIIQQEDPGRRLMVYDPPNADLVPYIDGLVFGAPVEPGSAILFRARLGEGKPVVTSQGQSHVHAAISPDLDQLRFEMFMPIIYGARGISYWMYSTARWHKKDKDLFNRVLDTAKDVSQITPAIVSEEPLPAWTPQHTVSGGGAKLTCAKDGAVYILAGQPAGKESGLLTFTLPANVKAELLFEKPQKTWAGEKVNITIPPSRVKILRLTCTK